MRLSKHRGRQRQPMFPCVSRGYGADAVIVTRCVYIPKQKDVLQRSTSFLLNCIRIVVFSWEKALDRCYLMKHDYFTFRILPSFLGFSAGSAAG